VGPAEDAAVCPPLEALRSLVKAQMSVHVRCAHNCAYNCRHFALAFVDSQIISCDHL
jgi:hypothetical protein